MPGQDPVAKLTVLVARLAEEKDPGARLLPLAEAVRAAAWGLRGVVGAGLRDGSESVDSVGWVLEWMFWTWDEFLGILHAIDSELKGLHDALVAEAMASRTPGAVFNDREAARIRKRTELLDNAMVNLSSCNDTLGGGHMLLGHAMRALSELETAMTADTTAGRHPTGAAKEAKADD